MGVASHRTAPSFHEQPPGVLGGIAIDEGRRLRAGGRPRKGASMSTGFAESKTCGFTSVG